MSVVSALRGKPLVPFQFDLNLCFGFLACCTVYNPPFTGGTPVPPCKPHEQKYSESSKLNPFVSPSL